MGSLISDPFGGVLISVFVSILLLGAMFVQLFIYFDHYPKDRLWIKLFVLVLFALDILNSVFVLAWVYKMLILNFGNIAAFSKADWTIATDPLLSGIMSGMVQFFFAWKIWVLTKNYFFFIAIGAFALASSAGGIATSTIAFMVLDTVNWVELRIKLDTPALVWLIPAAVCDLIIATIITVYLQRAKGPFKRTNRVLNRVIRLTMQNGLLTATVAVIDLVLILAIKDTPYYLFVAFILPKLYTNSAMSSLNARHVRNNDVEDDAASLSMVSGFWGSSPGRVSPLTTRPEEMFVNMGYGNRQDSDHHDADTVTSEDLPKGGSVGP
ncbi:uncharacterized protein BT62DRAFT_269774 [Guyanagaster necrorhizus]|uniref:DUF6534 domain-containing protein n=1 Tax=Guyanagaster necrorhizus TaxID=856835 RepID=A0A9P7W3G9_9AGAR|nr:uncharacterized protein BT62DRAFT_269774 [Guyanagaster necrorhizus MCA 3950]KAG7451884.1 hypothetical protein BT62DRAFT_269774 [Guyanagaster necrorhizus MCA 3950]